MLESGPQAPRATSEPLDPSIAQPLQELLRDLPTSEVRGDPATSVADVAYDSRRVAADGLFFCVPGHTTDGHAFAADAVAAGAGVLVVERWLDLPATQVLVPSVREAMGPVSAAFFGHPARSLMVAGVTGTNGKTTTTYLLESIFEAAGYRAGLIGTTGIRIGGAPLPAEHTTPEAPDLHRLLARMRDDGVGAVAMEVSSHGLDQHRVGGVRYACAVFTNLSQDHLDYHGTLEDYFLAKARLFTTEMAAAAAINRDSPEGRRLLGGPVPAVSYGLEPGADLRATEVEVTAAGIGFTVDDLRITSRLRGAFNVENCLAAMAAARALGLDTGASVRGLAEMDGVPGRFEAVDAGQDFTVLVDYAHTPDGIINVLRSARPLTAGRLIVVFGCGGDRDRGKRPLMGEAATSLADLTIVTSDNPRSEDPGAIIADIEPGARDGGGAYEIEPDRRAAIAQALAQAGPGDVVVIAGKGHETGQQFADHTIPFDDREVAGDELARMGGDG